MKGNDSMTTRRPRMRTRLQRLLLLWIPLFVVPLQAAELSPEQTARHFRVALQETAAHTAQAALIVESEALYTVRFSERPGMREMRTRPLDPVRMAAAPRPPFWWPEARVHWGDHLWDGRVESFTDDRPASLADPEKYRLTETRKARARGRDALLLVFDCVTGIDRVTVTVDRRTFEPLLVEQELRQPVTAYGAKLVEYRSTLSITQRAGYWLVAQGQETYRFTTPEGDRDVKHSWKALSWNEVTRPVLAAGPS